ncbi:hypothetical protein Q0590_24895 [Rhodocytophaga aerolata]|uniref:Uncharacterized protein n=1 Tax=Rhodocytophaga aerolata TaxID=455078 RepID=A0ABT8RBQ3_9BACT|nr:hypothetical protein [Rhodocytophaga aerolata]MDO1449538.1 hypothetical protein [Rhodocytophaga aerolata]
MPPLQALTLAEYNEACREFQTIANNSYLHADFKRALDCYNKRQTKKKDFIKSAELTVLRKLVMFYLYECYTQTKEYVSHEGYVHIAESFFQQDKKDVTVLSSLGRLQRTGFVRSFHIIPTTKAETDFEIQLNLSNKLFEQPTIAQLITNFQNR